MARLQDFQSVTPATSDNLLIVQSQGQGLSTLNAVGKKIAEDVDVTSLNTTSKKLVGAINEVNTTSQVFIPTLINVSSSTSANEEIKYYKSGKIVTMTVDIILAQTSQALAVFTLPVGFRPPVNITVNAQAFGNASNVARYCTINVNGNVVFYSTDAARLLFNVTFGT